MASALFAFDDSKQELLGALVRRGDFERARTARLASACSPVASSATILEDAAPLTVDLRALVTDVETADADLTYTIVSGPAPAEASLSATATNGVFSLDSAADFNGTASFTYSVTDRGDPDGCGAPGPACAAAETSAVLTFQVTVTPVNDAPVVAASAGALSVTENDPAAVVDAGLAVTDVDSADLAGATVAVTGNYVVGEDVLAFVVQLGIAGGWDAGTGVLTLSGTAGSATATACPSN